jgi:hypothetical protein
MKDGSAVEKVETKPFPESTPSAELILIAETRQVLLVKLRSYDQDFAIGNAGPVYVWKDVVVKPIKIELICKEKYSFDSLSARPNVAE